MDKRFPAILAAVFICLSGAALYSAAAPDVITLDDKRDSMLEAGVDSVKYPHAAHAKLYKCVDCHPRIFKDKRGANDITMKKNMDGQFCGSPNCHDSIKAFPLYKCLNCHTKIKAAK